MRHTLILLFLLFFCACRSAVTGPGPGEEKGSCYQNGTCNEGLTCVSDLCVFFDTDSAVDTVDGAVQMLEEDASSNVKPVFDSGMKTVFDGEDAGVSVDAAVVEADANVGVDAAQAALPRDYFIGSWWCTYMATLDCLSGEPLTAASFKTSTFVVKDEYALRILPDGFFYTFLRFENDLLVVGEDSEKYSFSLQTQNEMVFEHSISACKVDLYATGSCTRQ